MKARLELSPDAERDLLEIGYLIEADSPVAAARFVHSIERRIEMLSHFPESGHPRPDLGTGIRGLAFDRKVLVIYRPEPAVVSILRVFYGGKDIGPDDLG